MISDEQIEKMFSLRKKISSNKMWGFDLPEKEFLKGMSLLNPQSYGSRIQNYIQRQLNAERNKASSNIGDIKFLNKNLEVKTSLLTPDNCYLNMVQIRVFQPIDHYLCIAYDLRNLSEYDSYIFLLTHDEMLFECDKYGNAAHGTTTANKLNKNVEYRLGLKCEENNPMFMKWKKKYRMKNILEMKTHLVKK